MSESGRSASAEQRPEAGERRDRWTGLAVIDALRTATAHFEPYVPEINALNVFPVPDGDTGTNMFLTLQAAVREAEKLNHGQTPLAGAVMAEAARGALMGARGNSGVILYQILAGLADSTSGAAEIDGRALAAGLERAADLAYQAVINPVEGTMLTVIRAAADAAGEAARRDASVEGVLDAALRAAEETLQRTPELLAILRQAGVVDAGGQGLVVLLSGLARFVEGTTLDAPAAGPSVPARPIAATMDFLDQLEVIHGTEEFGYCTNFLLTGAALPVEEVKARMNQLGRSAVVVGDERGLKIHIHTDHPGTILEAALTYGDLHQIRIDNMSAQTQRLLAERAEQRPSVARLALEATHPIAVVAVASGAGLTEALEGMGAAAVVPGGPTFNPSTEDLLRAIQSLPQQEVILLPNDPNVIPTARHVDLLTTKTVRVVPSRSIPEGISALSAFNFEADLDENVAAMTEALGLVRSIGITRATRDAEIGGVRARAGQYIGLLDGDLRAASDDPVDALLRVLPEARPEEAELVTLFVGEPAAPDLGQRAAAAIEEAYPDLAVEVARGDQPHYHLIVSVE